MDSLKIAVQQTKTLIVKAPCLRKVQPFVESILYNKQDQTELLQSLYEFRSLHAKIIDEPPNEILTDQEMLQIFNMRPNTEADLSGIIIKSRGKLPESIDSWKKTIVRILQEGSTYWKTLNNRRDCHVCLGKFDYGHMAWGCVASYSQKAVSRFMNDPKNLPFKQRENERRRRNWQDKYGDIPCPYLDKE